MNTVKMTPEVVDYGDVQEIHVTGYSAISRISSGMIRETYYTLREFPDGTIERRLTLSLVWDAEQWIAAHSVEMMGDVQRLKPLQPPRIEAALH
jgi:hypothetical protein